MFFKWLKKLHAQIKAVEEAHGHNKIHVGADETYDIISDIEYKSTDKRG